MRSVQVALRSRRRQYQVRDLVRQLASLNQTLEQRVAQRTAEAVGRAQKLRLLSAELSLAEERERRRIAQVLHDDLQQMLMAAQLHLRTLNKTENAAERSGIIRNIQDMLERSFNLTRPLSATFLLPSCTTTVSPQHWNGLPLKDENTTAPKFPSMPILRQTQRPSTSAFSFSRRCASFCSMRSSTLLSSPVHITMKGTGSGKLRVIVSDRGPGFDRPG